MPPHVTILGVCTIEDVRRTARVPQSTCTPVTRTPVTCTPVTCTPVTCTPVHVYPSHVYPSHVYPSRAPPAHLRAARGGGGEGEDQSRE
eukprot:2588314-Prymnesium_polylepis.1